jgi:hypothetical protein
VIFRLGCLTAWAENPAASSDSLVSYLPDGALATVEFAKLEPLIERLETSPVLKAILDSPQWQDALKQDQVQKAMAGKAIAEGQLRMSLWDFAKTYFGDRMILAVYPPATPGGSPDGVLIIRVKQAESLKTLWERLSPLLPLAGDKLKVSDYEGGGRLFTATDGHQLVIRDRWVVLSKVKTLLDQTLRNLASPSSTANGDSVPAAWKQMAAQMGTDHHAQLCLNMTTLNTLVGHRVIPGKLDNGVISLLLGGYLEMAASSPYVGSTLDVLENELQLRTSVGGDVQKLDAAHQSFVVDGESGRADVPSMTSRLQGFSLTRDFAAWYRNREALLDAKLLPGFDKFETGLATFLPGRDFGEDVLPLLGKRLTIVSAPQSFAHLKGKPGVQLPGLAILLDLAKPAEANDLLTLVFQTVILISNLQAMQEGRQPFVMTSESYHDVQIAFAKYLKQPEGDKLPISANFQPASARVGNRFVVTTNVAMCRQMIDILQSESGQAAARSSVPPETVRDLYFDLSPEVVADLLQLNSSVLQAQSLQQGKSADQAARELDFGLKLLRQLTPITFSSTRHPTRWELEFRFGWK